MEANLNTRAYTLLFEIESVLRELLIEHCERAYGPKWWMESVLSDDARKRLSEAIRVGAERRRRDDRKAWTSRHVFHPLYFAELGDLAEAFRMKANHILDEICVASERIGVADQLNRLLPIRNSVAHMRLVSDSDLKQVESAHDLLAGTIGRSLFDQLAKTLPSQLAVHKEMAELASCFLRASDSVREMREVDLAAWKRLSFRWWLDSEWHLDSNSIRTGAQLLAEYQLEYQSDLVGRRARMERWTRDHWKPELVAKAVASLQREKTSA